LKTNAKYLLTKAGQAKKRSFFRGRKMPALGCLHHFSSIDTIAPTQSIVSSSESISDNSGHSRPLFGRLRCGLAAIFPVSLTAQSPLSNRQDRKRLRHLCSGIRNNKGVTAFTLVEAMIALGVMVLFTAACLSTIVVSQVSVRKAKEEAIAIDFLTKYAENLKALPFTSVITGEPINWELANAPYQILIPTSGSPVSVDNLLYKTFYPDLLWFANRNPTMIVTLTPSAVVGHDIEVNIKLDWDPPISKGGRQEVQVDFLRTKDASEL
jgi:type II secretory pathway pseudopilin PulG